MLKSRTLSAIAVLLSSVMGLRATAATEPLHPRQIYASYRHSVVTFLWIDALEAKIVSQGTAFFVAPDVIATNWHVAANQSIARVSAAVIRLSDGTMILLSGATVQNSDESRDVVFIKLPNDLNIIDDFTLREMLSRENPRETRKFEALMLSASHPEVGEPAYVIGSPMGLEQTLSQGIVANNKGTIEEQWIQVSTPISPGSSGSPVFDQYGKVFGIATSQVVGGQLLNFASSLLTQVPRTTDSPNLGTWARENITQSETMYVEKEFGAIKNQVLGLLRPFATGERQSPRLRKEDAINFIDSIEKALPDSPRERSSLTPTPYWFSAGSAIDELYEDSNLVEAMFKLATDIEAIGTTSPEIACFSAKMSTRRRLQAAEHAIDLAPNDGLLYWIAASEHANNAANLAKALETPRSASDNAAIAAKILPDCREYSQNALQYIESLFNLSNDWKQLPEVWTTLWTCHLVNVDFDKANQAIQDRFAHGNASQGLILTNSTRDQQMSALRGSLVLVMHCGAGLDDIDQVLESLRLSMQNIDKKSPLAESTLNGIRDEMQAVVDVMINYFPEDVVHAIARKHSLSLPTKQPG